MALKLGVCIIGIKKGNIHIESEAIGQILKYIIYKDGKITKQAYPKQEW